MTTHGAVSATAKPDANSVYRCGALTEAGVQAIAPEGQEKKLDLAASMRDYQQSKF
jgi:hypothetical protein